MSVVMPIGASPKALAAKSAAAPSHRNALEPKDLPSLNELQEQVVKGGAPAGNHQIVVAIDMDDDLLDALNAERGRLKDEDEDEDDDDDD